MIDTALNSTRGRGLAQWCCALLACAAALWAAPAVARPGQDAGRATVGALPPVGDAQEDLETLRFLLELVCILLNCDPGDPLIGGPAALTTAAELEAHMIDQINAYNAYGPRPDLTQAQIVQGRADAQTTQAFLADHPGLVSVSIAKSYSSMLTSLINDL